MSTEKGAVDNKPATINSVTRIPGSIGWGIERRHLVKENVLLTDDLSTNFPVAKEFVTSFDHHKTAKFSRMVGERAAVTDKKLGLDYEVYH